MKKFKRVLASVLTAAMVFSGTAFNTVSVSAAPALAAGWYETLYAEWADSDPDSTAVKVGYKLSSASQYTYLSGDDAKYLIRQDNTPGFGRVDIPGLSAGMYDIEITDSKGTKHTASRIQVNDFDRSGYAHWKYNSGVGAYNNDGTPKDNAVIVYVTDENKDTVEIPGYEGHAPVSYASSSSGATWTRETAGIGNILNNNHKFVYEVVSEDNHPIIFRFVGKVGVPKNLTPYNTKTNELGGSKGDNGNLAVCKYAKNITIEGIGDDAEIDGWGFTFSQTSTCPADSGESFEVRNLTFRNYTEDALGFQGDDPITSPIRRVWVHNNVFYPGYCANPAESDKGEGDGSLDFKRGQYYTMSYNHYIKCHKTNLLGAGDSNDQFYMSLHHNWYEDVDSRQPLAAGGNLHIYNTYFSDSMTGGGNGKSHCSSVVVDIRGKANAFTENNYFENVKNPYNSRKATSYLKTYGDILAGNTENKGKTAGKTVNAATRDQAGPGDNGLKFPDGSDMTNWDTNPAQFYWDSTNKRSDVRDLLPAEEVPEFVKTYAGTMKELPVTEWGTLKVDVSNEKIERITDASVTAPGLTFTNNGDGSYIANKVRLGVAYTVTVSKEGYSNFVIDSRPIEENGGEAYLGVILKEDVDGYAVVSLTGGKDDEPVDGADIKLADGTVLAGKGGGIYSSEKQLKTGTYKAVITNTGDFIAPTGSIDVVVKTTDAATPVHLEKKTGKVTVKLAKAAGETNELNTEKAVVKIGDTELTGSGDTFTGDIEVGTAYPVSVSVPAWSVVSINPASVTAKADAEVSVSVVLKHKGALYTWNPTEDINTEEFFDITGDDWGDAKKDAYHKEYDGSVLAAALKMNSGGSISFDAPMDGDVTMVISAKKDPVSASDKIIITDADGNHEYTLYDYLVPGTTDVFTIPVKAGLNTIKRQKQELAIYYVQYAGEGTSAGGDTDVLSDEIMWDITKDTENNDIAVFGETFKSGSEENGAVTFTDADGKTYELADFIQGTSDPKNKDGVNPQGELSTDRIPASGAYIKLTPSSDGTFTIAAKTGAGKTTYITDGEGKVLVTKGGDEASYDVVSFDVKAGETRYVYSGGSKIAIYYIGFTSSGNNPNPPAPPVTDASGDADGSGKITSNDAAMVFKYAMENNSTEDVLKICDVDGDGKITASDASQVLTKTINESYTYTTAK